LRNKLLSYLGLARRAGKLSLGYDPVLDSVAAKEAKLVLTAGDLSPRTLRNGKEAAAAHGVSLLETDIPMAEFSFALGKRVGIVSVNDSGFATQIKRLWDDIIEKTVETTEKQEEM
jgi:ribosomal protein L7Ae-like RNA K-turn-binding protein